MTVKQPRKTRKSSEDVRERILSSAYKLFSTQGIAQVGVDAIVADSGCAKASLYNNFPSKEALALAFLEEREARWTRGWLEDAVRRRTSDPAERLLAIFDVFSEWFQRRDFEGCAFIDVLLESDFETPVSRAAAAHLRNIRAIVRGFAVDAGLDDCDAFAQAWHMLMKGSIVAAREGHKGSGEDAKKAARLILAGWPRKAPG